MKIKTNKSNDNSKFIKRVYAINHTEFNKNESIEAMNKSKILTLDTPSKSRNIGNSLVPSTNWNMSSRKQNCCYILENTNWLSSINSNKTQDDSIMNCFDSLWKTDNNINVSKNQKTEEK